MTEELQEETLKMDFEKLSQLNKKIKKTLIEKRIVVFTNEAKETKDADGTNPINILEYFKISTDKDPFYRNINSKNDLEKILNNIYQNLDRLNADILYCYDDNKNKSILLEIKNLNLRLTLIRYMQLFGVLCLFLSVFAMLLLYISQETIGIYIFGVSLLCLLISLGISFWEISISVNALRVHLKDLTEEIE